MPTPCKPTSGLGDGWRPLVEVAVEQMLDPPPAERECEVVERKGVGHPDSICDALAEEFSLALCRFHRERFGHILHHNVDKVLLVGGSSAPQFGGGEIEAPFDVYLSGRAATSYGGVHIPVQDLAEAAVQAWLRQHLPELDLERQLRLHVRVRPGAGELASLFAAGSSVPLANDSSCGVGFAPPTPLERTVLAVEAALQQDRAAGRAPHVGSDIKVLGMRRRLHTHLTVAAAMIDRHVADADDYRGKVEALAQRVLAVTRPLLPGDVTVAVNAADDVAHGRCYLTVSGTSAEAGDDGEAGRGNRTGGLITPCRPMTMEATAGKNPINHVGKLYNILAHLVATELAAALPQLQAVECLLASQIGAPIDAPRLACVRARAARGIGPLAAEMATRTCGRIATAPELWRDILDRNFKLY